MRSDEFFPDPFNFSRRGPRDIEFADIEEQMYAIGKKMQNGEGEDEESARITNMDIIQYLKLINFNFVTLSGVLKTLLDKQETLVQNSENLQNKFNTFIEATDNLGKEIDGLDNN